MGPASLHCIRQVWTFLYNILGPIALGAVPYLCPSSVRVQYEKATTDHFLRQIKDDHAHEVGADLIKVLQGYY